jgi:hypothetical protein
MERDLCLVYQHSTLSKRFQSNLFCRSELNSSQFNSSLILFISPDYFSHEPIGTIDYLLQSFGRMHMRVLPS